MTKKLIIGNLRLTVSLNRRLGRGRKILKISRFLRFILEKKGIKNFFGLNLAMAVLFTNVVGQPISAFSLNSSAEITAISPTVTPLTTNQSARVPLTNTVINQGFSLFHRGIDFDGVIGEPVYPAIEGTVEQINRSHLSYGNYILINHGQGFTSLYAHLSKILVKAGDQVDKNTVIGLVGKSGWATGPHLHFEILENGRPINPLTILPSK